MQKNFLTYGPCIKNFTRYYIYTKIFQAFDFTMHTNYFDIEIFQIMVTACTIAS